MKFNLAGLQRSSIVDGPGVRYTIFFQGCSHKCVDCHNPGTHSYSAGKYTNIDDVISDIAASGVKDVTISGGEPFDQAEELYYLVKKLKVYEYSIWIYTGYIFEDLLKKQKCRIVLENTDVLVDGPYIKSKSGEELRFRGSNNQRIIDVQKSLRQMETILLHLD